MKEKKSIIRKGQLVILTYINDTGFNVKCLSIARKDFGMRKVRERFLREQDAKLVPNGEQFVNWLLSIYLRRIPSLMLYAGYNVTSAPADWEEV